MQVRVAIADNIYSVDMKNVVPQRALTCLFAKATVDESKLWHRRLGPLNFKTINKLVKGNLVRGLPSKIFDNNEVLWIVKWVNKIEPLVSPKLLILLLYLSICFIWICLAQLM